MYNYYSAVAGLICAHAGHFLCVPGISRFHFLIKALGLRRVSERTLSKVLRGFLCCLRNDFLPLFATCVFGNALGPWCALL